MSADEWDCECCLFHNGSSAMECVACGAQNPTVASTAADEPLVAAVVQPSVAPPITEVSTSSFKHTTSPPTDPSSASTQTVIAGSYLSVAPSITAEVPTSSFELTTGSPTDTSSISTQTDDVYISAFSSHPAPTQSTFQTPHGNSEFGSNGVQLGSFGGGHFSGSSGFSNSGVVPTGVLFGHSNGGLFSGSSGFGNPGVGSTGVIFGPSSGGHVSASSGFSNPGVGSTGGIFGTSNGGHISGSSGFSAFGSGRDSSSAVTGFGFGRGTSGLFGSGRGSSNSYFSSTPLHSSPPYTGGGFGFSNGPLFSQGFFPNSAANHSQFGFGNLVDSVDFETIYDDGVDEEEYVPPKVEPVVHTENGAIYTVRCKLFYKKEGDWIEMGLATLFLIPFGGGRTQMLIRAENSLGNILLNIQLTSEMPVSRQGSNNVSLVCLPNPPLESSKAIKRPVCMLIRVKTGEMADELLAKINEYKMNH